MESAPEDEADPRKRVPMTKEQKRIKELEEENTIFRTYFQVCAENETDPQKKDFTSDWRMQRTWDPSQAMP